MKRLFPNATLVQVEGADNRFALLLEAMGVRKGDLDFLSYLDSWLASQRDDGWLGDCANCWATTTDWMK